LQVEFYLSPNQLLNGWADGLAKAKREDEQFKIADGPIAATALEHELTLVTRNVKDFAGFGVAIFSPWES
jgi:predicted nucleic acid-binding protein